MLSCILLANNVETNQHGVWFRLLPLFVCATMPRMRRHLVMLAAVLAPACSLCGHGIPIDIIVQEGQLAPFSLDGRPVFQPARLNTILHPAILSADTPGFGVANLANGVAPDTKLGVDVVSPLSFWNGKSLATTPANLEILIPTDDIVYQVHAHSDAQKGMQIGLYDGSRAWEQDGLYSLTPVDAEPGIYGIMIQLTSPNYASSEPFLFPLIVDPQSMFTNAQLRTGRDMLGSHLANPADVNFDGEINALDVDSICSNLGSAELQYDVNLDSTVDLADVAAWIDERGTVNGDANLNGVVDFPDFVQLARDFGRDSDTIVWTSGDFNCDGMVSFSDFTVLAANFGRTASATATTTAVPEPRSWLYACLFFALLPHARRRRPQRAHLFTTEAHR